MEEGPLVFSNGYSGYHLVLAYLATGLWLSATGGAWLLGLRTVVAGLMSDRRRLVSALRWGTLAGIVDLFGLAVMVTVANPVQWQTLGWLISLAPLGLAFLGVLLGSRPVAPGTGLDPEPAEL